MRTLAPPIQPMLLTSADAPAKGPYVHQVKFDGHRCILHYRSRGVQLYTRTGNDCTRQYPELQLVRLCAESAVLDGEMIVLDQGKLCFESVIRRLRAQSESTIRRLSQTMPAHFVAFDVLSVDGQDVTRRLLEERLELLERVVQPSEYISVCKTFDDGSALFHAVAKMGLEGIVSKRLGSRYVVGVRSMDWLKVKHYQYRVVDIIGIRKGEFGWLLGDGGQPLGVLEFAPPVARKALIQYARTKALVYTENKHWLFIQPVRCKVKFQSYTKNGLLRSASFVHFVV